MVDGQYVYEMKLTGGVTDYDATTRAATTKAWKEGDVLFLRFTGGTATLGIATYDGFKWSLKTDVSLVGSGSCTVVSIDGTTTMLGNNVEISPFNAVYEGKDCTWSFVNNTLTVHATLDPMMGRLRFKGDAETVVSVTGLTTYTSFDRSTGQFATTKSAVKTSIQSDRYTPYIYGILSDTSSPQLSVNGYVMECPATMLKAGQSGWLNCPTPRNYNGWELTPSGHEAVDLGLSVLWASCNVGASFPEDYGDYYAWGETETKNNYAWSTYKWIEKGYSDLGHINKYQILDDQQFFMWYQDFVFVGDNKQVLDSEDDVAHVKWGGRWRMPTDVEWTELHEQCTWTWSTYNGTDGYKVRSKLNGNFIFLPAAGIRDEEILELSTLAFFFWSSSLSKKYTDMAFGLAAYSSSIIEGNNDRYNGMSVRPVFP